MAGMCPPGLVIKNTFICVLGAEALSPNMPRRRAKTADEAYLDSPVSSSLEEDIPSADELTVPAERCSELAIALEAGGAAASAAIAEVLGALRALAFDPIGCHIVERAIEVARSHETQALAAGLRGMSCEAALSPHAHRVLIKAVCCLHAEDTRFIAEELLGQGRRAALNANASEVLCQLLRFHPADRRTHMLVDDVLSGDIAALCLQKFGHRVAMSIVSTGTSQQRNEVVAALRGDLQRFARHRFAGQVLAHVLTSCPANECDTLAVGLMSRPGAVTSLACHSFGVQVVRALLQLPKHSGQVLQYLNKSSRRLLKDRYGRELMLDLSLSTPTEAALQQAPAVPELFGGAAGPFGTPCLERGLHEDARVSRARL